MAMDNANDASERAAVCQWMQHERTRVFSELERAAHWRCGIEAMALIRFSRGAAATRADAGSFVATVADRVRMRVVLSRSRRDVFARRGTAASRVAIDCARDAAAQDGHCSSML
ncbi:hypothetical protein [Lysobacter enzymogenes]|uniref:hypothetical protein n=1 Tax=Lysobacter enzymogenes TaxID=69 RepID=UPI001A96A056|nr:hypothetical protein [Lysobacter enzymogenes]QQP97598.1 hypothetical protein JHW38_06150 [Lysobacter enzymogenes]